MSSATLLPTSASSDSGSSASLTPTAHGFHGFEPTSSVSTTAAGAATTSSSLFNSAESKFMSESLSSAESFDPFTIGAPGFKVPSMLPPGITSPPFQQTQLDSGNGPISSPASNSSLAGSSSGLDLRAIAEHMRSRSASGHQPNVDPYSSIGGTHRLSNNTWNPHAYRGNAQADEHASTSHGISRHASFSGASPSGFGVSGAGYGKNKAWQMEQLSFLEAQANRGSQHEVRRSSTSVLLSPTDAVYGQPYYNNGDDGSGGLALLGPQFPSSHSFPLHTGQNHDSSRAHPPGVRMHGGVHPTEVSAAVLGMMSGNAGLEAASASFNSRGIQTPKAGDRPLPASALANGRAGQGQSPDVHDRIRTGVMSSSPSSSSLKRTASGSEKVASSTDDGPSAVMSRALGELADLDLDLVSAVRVLPAYLHQYYLPDRIEKKYQPHLEMLRRQHIQDGLMDDAGREIKKTDSKQQDEDEEEKEKKAHTLLTTEEKKANHIASEQKRRANIRKGYELLCEIVPALREALEREAKRSKHDNDSDDGSSGAEDSKKGKGAKAKKKGSAGKKVQTDDEAVAAAAGGIEVDGEKIDGRAGPRSEAVVLMKSLEHISMLLERFRGLLGRRNRARLAVARSKGWDGLAKDQHEDIESMLADKIAEWCSQHAEDEKGSDSEDDDDTPGDESMQS